jgi:hypothetical protein
MKIKAVVIACVVIVVSFCAWSVGRTQQTAGLPSGQNGRYQVVGATVDFSATGGMPAKQTVIRVDTETGKTWELFEQKSSTAGIETLWIPINESH